MNWNSDRSWFASGDGRLGQSRYRAAKVYHVGANPDKEKDGRRRGEALPPVLRARSLVGRWVAPLRCRTLLPAQRRLQRVVQHHATHRSDWRACSRRSRACSSLRAARSAKMTPAGRFAVVRRGDVFSALCKRT